MGLQLQNNSKKETSTGRKQAFAFQNQYLYLDDGNKIKMGAWALDADNPDHKVIIDAYADCRVETADGGLDEKATAEKTEALSRQLMGMVHIEYNLRTNPNRGSLKLSA